MLEAKREIGGIKDDSGNAVGVSAKIVARAVILSIKLLAFSSRLVRGFRSSRIVS
jgi:hypothetical protein